MSSIRPEQQRLPTLRTSLRPYRRLPAAAPRAGSRQPYEDADHVMTYLFADIARIEAFNDLSVALRNAGRTPFVLPPVQRGVTTPKPL